MRSALDYRRQGLRLLWRARRGLGRAARVAAARPQAGRAVPGVRISAWLGVRAGSRAGVCLCLGTSSSHDQACIDFAVEEPFRAGPFSLAADGEPRGAQAFPGCSQRRPGL